MDTFNRSNLASLLAATTPPCVSVYLPTHNGSPEGQQDPVQLKNLLAQAEEELSGNWVRTVEARRLLERARQLPSDAEFWKARSQGLALFVAPDVFQAYRLPWAFAPSVDVGRAFSIRPILPALTGDERFFVLALSQKRVELTVGDARGLTRVEIPDLPESMAAALNYTSVEHGSQARSSSWDSRGSKKGTVYHGHGGTADTSQEDLVSYFRQVDAAVREKLRGEDAPLFLACVDYLAPLYRQVNSYDSLANQTVVGNADHLSLDQLYRLAWPLAAQLGRREESVAKRRFHELAGSERASDELDRIVMAARESRVETLLLARDARRFGHVDPATGQLEIHDAPRADDEELLELAARETLRAGGKVMAFPAEELPTQQVAAALFRY